MDKLKKLWASWTKRESSSTIEKKRNLYTIIVTGALGSGISRLVFRILEIKEDDFDPTNDDIYYKNIDLDGTAIPIHIIDANFVEEYSPTFEYYMRSGDCFVLVYSNADRKSFDKIQKIQQKASGAREGKCDFIVVKDSNVIEKLDDESENNNCEQVSEADIEQWCQSINSPHLELSAESDCVNAFYQLIRDILRTK